MSTPSLQLEDIQKTHYPALAVNLMSGRWQKVALSISAAETKTDLDRNQGCEWTQIAGPALLHYSSKLRPKQVKHGKHAEAYSACIEPGNAAAGVSDL